MRYTFGRCVMLKAVLADFLPLIAALSLAAATYILRERHRRRTRIDPARPDLTLAEITTEHLPEPGNLHELRRQILHHATVALYLENILDLHCADPAPEDWFEHYRAMAAPFIREKLHAAHESQANLVEIYTALLQDLQKRLLRSRPKKRFVPPFRLPA